MGVPGVSSLATWTAGRLRFSDLEDGLLGVSLGVSGGRGSGLLARTSSSRPSRLRHDGDGMRTMVEEYPSRDGAEARHFASGVLANETRPCLLDVT